VISDFHTKTVLGAH